MRGHGGEDDHEDHNDNDGLINGFNQKIPFHKRTNVSQSFKFLLKDINFKTMMVMTMMMLMTVMMTMMMMMMTVMMIMMVMMMMKYLLKDVGFKKSRSMLVSRWGRR